MLHKYIVVFDLETTGFNPKENQIIELAAVKYELIDDKYELVKEINHLIKCHYPLPDTIVKITNITDEMLANHGISQKEAFDSFLSLIEKDTLLVAYNIAFDLSFIQFLHRYYFDPAHIIQNDILDVMAIYKDRHSYPHKLDDAVKKYQVDIKNTHRALDDVKATFAVLTKMHEQHANIPRYINKIGFNKKYGAPKLAMSPKVKYVEQGFNGKGEIANSK